MDTVHGHFMDSVNGHWSVSTLLCCIVYNDGMHQAVRIHHNYADHDLESWVPFYKPYVSDSLLR